jgi:hypothetical protein
MGLKFPYFRSYYKWYILVLNYSTQMYYNFSGTSVVGVSMRIKFKKNMEK